MSYSISASSIAAALAATPTRAKHDVSRLRLDVTPNIDVVTVPGSTGKTAHVMSRTVRIYQDTRVATHVVAGI